MCQRRKGASRHLVYLRLKLLLFLNLKSRGIFANCVSTQLLSEDQESVVSVLYHVTYSLFFVFIIPLRVYENAVKIFL